MSLLQYLGHDKTDLDLQAPPSPFNRQDVTIINVGVAAPATSAWTVQNNTTQNLIQHTAQAQPLPLLILGEQDWLFTDCGSFGSEYSVYQLWCSQQQIDTK